MTEFEATYLFKLAYEKSLKLLPPVYEYRDTLILDVYIDMSGALTYDFWDIQKFQHIAPDIEIDLANYRLILRYQHNVINGVIIGWKLVNRIDIGI